MRRYLFIFSLIGTVVPYPLLEAINNRWCVFISDHCDQVCLYHSPKLCLLSRRLVTAEGVRTVFLLRDSSGDASGPTLQFGRALDSTYELTVCTDIYSLLRSDCNSSY